METVPPMRRRRMSEPSPLSRSTILTLCAMVCVSAVAVDVNMPVLPLVAQSLGADIQQAQMIVSLYLFGYAAGQIPAGLASDRYGRLPLVYLGLGLYVLGGLVAFLSHEIAFILLGRVVQGLGGAAAAVLGRAIVRDVASGSRSAELMGLLVSLLGVTTLLAPLLGSALAQWLHWRSTFAVSVVFGLAVGVMAWRHVPETRPRRAAAHGAARQLWYSARAFFSNGRCVWGAVLVGASFGGYLCVITGSASVIVEVYGRPAGLAGPIFAISALAYLFGAAMSRRYVARFGVAAMVRTAASIFAVATVLLAGVCVLGEVSLFVLWTAVTVYLLGCGLMLPNATAVALEPLPQLAGFSSSIVGTLQIGVGAITSALTAALYDGSALAMVGVMCACGLLTVLAYLIGRWRFA